MPLVVHLRLSTSHCQLLLLATLSLQYFLLLTPSLLADLLLITVCSPYSSFSYSSSTSFFLPHPSFSFSTSSCLSHAAAPPSSYLLLLYHPPLPPIPYSTSFFLSSPSVTPDKQ